MDSGLIGLDSSPGRGHCVVFLGKTLHSDSASLHPGDQGHSQDFSKGGGGGGLTLCQTILSWNFHHGIF